jgi:hypothetical protein
MNRSKLRQRQWGAMAPIGTRALRGRRAVMRSSPWSTLGGMATRDAAQTIFRTVVFAGAMLGTSACTKKPAPAAPSNNATTTPTEPAKPSDQPTDQTANPCATKPDPCAANPCRPRPPANPCGGGVGRGFILS